MAELAYRSELAEVWLGDARDVLAERATESVDLVLTDPPYGVEWQSSRRVARLDLLAGDSSDEREGIHEVLEECVRCVGQNRHLYVFGPSDVLAGLKITAPTELIWDKGVAGLGDLSSPWAPEHERISFAVSKHRHAGESGTDSLAARVRKGSVLRFPRRTGRTVRHPTEKPIDLCGELIESSSSARELVLDPFAGVGSTGVAAILRGRRVLLVEIREEYLLTAIDRIRSAEALAERAALL